MSLVLLTLASLATAQAADDWNPSPEQEAVYRALSVRHDPPACSALDAMSADEVATLAANHLPAIVAGRPGQARTRSLAVALAAAEGPP